MSVINPLFISLIHTDEQIIIEKDCWLLFE